MASLQKIETYSIFCLKTKNNYIVDQLVIVNLPWLGTLFCLELNRCQILSLYMTFLELLIY